MLKISRQLIWFQTHCETFHFAQLESIGVFLFIREELIPPMDAAIPTAGGATGGQIPIRRFANLLKYPRYSLNK
jgi:hypothetical protein